MHPVRLNLHPCRGVRLIQVLVDANGFHSLVLLLPMLKQHPSGCPRLARAQWVITRLHTVAVSLSQRLCAPQVVPEPCFLFRAECRWVSTAPRLLHAPHAVGYAHGRRPSFLQVRCNREVYPSHRPLRSLAAQPLARVPQPWIAASQAHSLPTSIPHLLRLEAAERLYSS
jgi:hypothetical protein